MSIDLKEFLHLYLGCDVQYPDIDGKKIISKLTGCSSEDGVEITYKRKIKGCRGAYLAWSENGNHNSNALNTKPILRSLFNVTSDEIDELNLDINQVMIIADKKIPYMSPIQFKKCLDMQFDLFGIIDLKLGLDKVKLKS